MTDGKKCSKMVELKKEVTPSLLLDFYGQTLTGKQREVMELYYNEDLSLSEIAENQEISRQAALDSIRRAEKHLEQMEQKAGDAGEISGLHGGGAGNGMPGKGGSE